MTTSLFPPGPSTGLVGFRLARAFRSDPLGFSQDLARTYGDVVSCRFGPFHAYFLFHPEHIRDFLVIKHKSFHKMPWQRRVLAQWGGNGLLLSEGDFWLRQRRLVQPAFQPRRLATYAETMTAQTKALVATWRAQGGPDGGCEVPITQAMTDLTLRIAAKTFFGAEVGDETPQLREAVNILSSVAIREMSHVFGWPNWLPLPSVRRKMWAIEYLDTAVRGFIQRRRASGEDAGDLLSMLLLAVDEHEGRGGMTDAQARDEAMVLFLAGHDTTAAGLAWALYLLAQHPDAQRRAVAEVARVLEGRTPTYGDFAELTYLTMVVKEALRLYPPAIALFARQAIEDVELAGYTIRKGSVVYTFPWVVHRDPRWFPDPDRFSPERFTPDQEKQRPAFAYFPFGGGPRVCIGNAFAMTEMVLVLAVILQQLEISLRPDQGAVGLLAQMSLRPQGDIYLRFRPHREPSASAT